MRIAIDISQINRDRAGVNRYLKEVIERFMRLDAEHEFVLCMRQEEKLDWKLPSNFSRLTVPDVPKWLGGGFTWYCRLGLELRRQKVDRLICVSMNVAPLFFPTVMVIHDLSPITHGHTFEWSLKWRFWFSTIITRYFATKIATVTDTSKQVFLDKFPGYSDSINVTNEGLPAWVYAPTSPEAQIKVRKKLDLPSKYFFSLGTVQPRKNYLRAIQGFSKIADKYQDLNYLIGGGFGWKYQKIKAEVSRLGLQNRVRFLGFVDEDDLPHVMDNAIGYVQLSVDEGFGLPLIEARARGLPILASDIPVFKEIDFDYEPIWADPLEKPEIAAGMQELIHKPRQQPSDEFLSSYSWDTAAKNLLQAVIN